MFAQLTCLRARRSADIKAHVTSKFDELFCHKIQFLCGGSKTEKGVCGLSPCINHMPWCEIALNTASAGFPYYFKIWISCPRGRHTVTAQGFPWEPVRIRAQVHGAQVLLAAGGGQASRSAPQPSVCPGAVMALRLLGLIFHGVLNQIRVTSDLKANIWLLQYWQ